jgi:hypothetical protein
MKRVRSPSHVSSFGLPATAAIAAVAPSPSPTSQISSNLDSTARALVAAINSSDPKARTDFIDRALATDVSAADRTDLASLLSDLHDESGGLEMLKVEPIGRGRFITAKATRHPRLALINIAPARSQPDKLGVIELLKSWNPKSDSVIWPTTPLWNDRAVAGAIEKNLQTLAGAGAFSGVVLVGKGDSVLFERGYGWANLEDSVPNTPQSSITIASIGKMFTATAIGQPIAGRKAQVRRHAVKVLPEYQTSDPSTSNHHSPAARSHRRTR